MTSIEQAHFPGELKAVIEKLAGWIIREVSFPLAAEEMGRYLNREEAGTRFIFHLPLRSRRLQRFNRETDNLQAEFRAPRCDAAIALSFESDGCDTGRMAGNAKSWTLKLRGNCTSQHFHSI